MASGDMYPNSTYQPLLAAGVVLALAGTVWSACSSGSGNSTTGPSAAFSVQAVQVLPQGTGVQHQTAFQFDATGSFPAGTQFSWNFGVGSAVTTTQPRATHAYDSPGEYTVTVQATNGSNSAVGSTRVRVGSLVGTWQGSVSGHTNVPRNRPVPVTAFELRVEELVRALPGFSLRATWSDDAGCRVVSAPFTSGGISYAGRIRHSPSPAPNREVSFSLEGFQCNGPYGDQDMSFRGTANETFTIVEGSCGGSCTFRMVRR
jgi:hypothetical protein